MEKSSRRSFPFILSLLLGICVFFLVLAAADAERVPAADAGKSPDLVRQVTKSADLPVELPPGTWERMRNLIEQEGYRIRTGARTSSAGDQVAFTADNRAHRFVTEFTPDGIRIQPHRAADRNWNILLETTAWGREGKLHSCPKGDFAVEGNHLEYRRGSLTEWYVNNAAGLEQGFILTDPPVDPGRVCDKEGLVIEMAVSGSILPVLSGNGRAVSFEDDEGSRILEYGGLVAWDASGRELPARLGLRWLEVSHGVGASARILLFVDDARAIYPVTIDPVFTQEVKLNASDGFIGNYFGYSVSISGDTIIIGARYDSENGRDAGAAYIFERDHGGADNWGEVKKLTPSDAASYNYFGVSASISGDAAVVGAVFGVDGDGIWTGAAYIFERDHGGAGNWGEVKKLLASAGERYDHFGESVSISGNTAVVGANSDNDNGGFSGSAYVFERDHGGVGNWGEVRKLIPADNGEGDRFGNAVAISGDTIVVGAIYENGGSGSNPCAGAAYIFERDHGGAGNWGEVKKLTASDAASFDYFGTSVSVSGDTALVGAPYNGDISAGAVYIYERDLGGAGNWGEAKKLIAGDGAASDHFGDSVAISGDTAVIGVCYDDNCGVSSGSAYVFDRDHGGVGSWGEVDKLEAEDCYSSENFGLSVSISGATIVIGKPTCSEFNVAPGSAYVFTSGCRLGIPDRILDLRLAKRGMDIEFSWTPDVKAEGGYNLYQTDDVTEARRTGSPFDQALLPYVELVLED